MACNKKAYHSKREARDFKKFLKRKHHAASKIYRCKTCGNWHLTTERKSLDHEWLKTKMAYMIQNKQGEYLEHLSNTRTKWLLIIDGMSYIVTYNKRNKTVWVNSCFSNGKN